MHPSGGGARKSIEFKPREKRVPVTLNLSQKVLDSLRAEAESKNVSLNVLMERILSSYALFHKVDALKDEAVEEAREQR